MNIFILDNDPVECAKYHNDKHVVKMILETAQLLSTAHRLCESPYAEQVYKATHKNHPCAVWVRESAENYSWTYRLFLALGEEYKFRYQKTHLSIDKLANILHNIPEGIPSIGKTLPAQAMPDDYKDENTVLAYRKYYMGDKRHLAGWTNRNVPGWWK